MALQETILKLIVDLKNKNLSASEKQKIKNKLKVLYRKLRGVRVKRVKIQSPYKEEVENILRPIKQTILTDKQKITQLKKAVVEEIKILRERKKDAEPEEKKQIDILINHKKIEEEILKDGEKNKDSAITIVEKVEQIKGLKSEDELLDLAVKTIRKNANSPKGKSTINLLLSNAVAKIHGKRDPAIVKRLAEAAQAEIMKEEEASARERERVAEEQRQFEEELAQLAADRLAEQEQLAQQQGQAGMEQKQTDPLDLVYAEYQATQFPGAEYDARRNELYKNLASDLDDPIINQIKEARQRGEPIAKNLLSGIIDEVMKVLPEGSALPKQLQEYQLGHGKLKSKYKYMNKKLKGGAGIADWMLTLGSIPGVPQLMNNMGPFGQVLGNASGLAQSFGKTAGQLMKEQSKDGEKVAGFTDALSPLKSIFGFGKPPAIISKCNKHLLQGGSLKDFWNKHKNKLLAIGIPTATVLGALGSIAIGDKMIKDKNKALGIVEPVKATFFSRATPPPVEDLYTESSERPQLFNWDGTPSKDNLFGYDLSGRGANMADMADLSGGAFLSDFLGTLGGITPKISGIVGAVPTYGKVATIGNSVLGSASRVGEDIARMLGLGNMDMTGTAPRTTAGHGNMDMTGKTKGYGKKRGGRKMLPYDRPMPRDMMGILPYGLQAEYPHTLEGGNYDIVSGILGAAGNILKAGATDLANSGASFAKDLAKKGVQGLADKAIQSIGKGRRKKMKGGFLPLLAMMGMGENMTGRGKINGKNVSSEFEDLYENAMAQNLSKKQLMKLQAERQFENQISSQLNMEQQSALSQLQYYDLLRRAQMQQ